MTNCSKTVLWLGAIFLNLNFGGSANGEIVPAWYVTDIDDAETSLSIERDGQEKPIYTESHGLIIGQVNYTSWDDLVLVPDEAAKVAKALERQHFKIELYYDLSSDNMIGVIDSFMRRHGTIPKSRVVVYITGHGFARNPGEQLGYLIPVDAPGPKSPENEIAAKAVPMQLFKAWAHMPDPRHALFVFDACFSGAFFGFRSDANSEPVELPPVGEYLGRQVQLSNGDLIFQPEKRGEEYSDTVLQGPSLSQSGRQFLAAGNSNEPAPVKSVMTRLFIAGLNDEISNLQNTRDDWISASELGRWIESNTASVARVHFKDDNPANPVFGLLGDTKFYQQGDMVFVRQTRIGINVVESAETKSKWQRAISKPIRTDDVLRSEAATKLAEIHAEEVRIKVLAENAAKDLASSNLAIKQANAQINDLRRSMNTNVVAQRIGIKEQLKRVTKSQTKLVDRSQQVLSTDKVLKGKLQILQAVKIDLSKKLNEETAIRKDQQEKLAEQAAKALSPQSSQLAPVEETLLRNLIDTLSSDSRADRRKARVDLANLMESLSKEQKGMLVEQLVTDLDRKSYRYQVGVSQAISDQKKKVFTRNAKVVQGELRDAMTTRPPPDKVLSKLLQKALSNIVSLG